MFNINNIINILLIAILVYCGIKELKQGVFLYCFFIFFAPVFSFGSIKFSFDILSFPVLFMLYLFKSSGEIRLTKREIALVIYLIFYVIITTVHTFRAIQYLSIINVRTYGVARFVFTLIIMHNVWRGKVKTFVDRLLMLVVPLEFIVSFIQIIGLVPIEIFYKLYYKPSLTPLQEVMNEGLFRRAYGTMGTPVILGGILLFSFSYYFYKVIMEKPTKKAVIYLLLTIICSFFVLSKIPIIGAPIIVLLGVFWLLTKDKKRRISNLKTLGKVMLIGIPIFACVVMWLNARGIFINYYLRFLLKPFDALKTRYSPESGILSGTIEQIKQNFWLGLGFENTNSDVFVGDSLFVEIMYHTGFVGLILYLTPYFCAFVNLVRKNNFLGVSFIVAFMLCATAFPITVSPYFVVFIATVFDIEGNKSTIVINYQPIRNA